MNTTTKQVAGTEKPSWISSIPGVQTKNAVIFTKNAV